MSFSGAIPVPGRAWRMLTLTELKLLLRTPAALFWGVGFPLVGLIVLGLIPGTGQPVKVFGGASVLQTYLPIIITFMLVMTGVQFLPATLVGYRERGILRRMFTTPVTPRALLPAQRVQAIQDAAAGRWASGLYFGVLAAWVIVCGVLAVRLFISKATVKTHLLHIYAKLNVNDRAAAVATGFGRGLLPRTVD